MLKRVFKECQFCHELFLEEDAIKQEVANNVVKQGLFCPNCQFELTHSEFKEYELDVSAPLIWSFGNNRIVRCCKRHPITGREQFKAKISPLAYVLLVIGIIIAIAGIWELELGIVIFGVLIIACAYPIVNQGARVSVSDDQLYIQPSMFKWLTKEIAVPRDSVKFELREEHYGRGKSTTENVYIVLNNRKEVRFFGGMYGTERGASLSQMKWLSAYVKYAYKTDIKKQDEEAYELPSPTQRAFAGSFSKDDVKNLWDEVDSGSGLASNDEAQLQQVSTQDKRSELGYQSFEDRKLSSVNDDFVQTRKPEKKINLKKSGERKENTETKSKYHFKSRSEAQPMIFCNKCHHSFLEAEVIIDEAQNINGTGVNKIREYCPGCGASFKEVRPRRFGLKPFKPETWTFDKTMKLTQSVHPITRREQFERRNALGFILLIIGLIWIGFIVLYLSSYEFHQLLFTRFDMNPIIGMGTLLCLTAFAVGWFIGWPVTRISVDEKNLYIRYSKYRIGRSEYVIPRDELKISEEVEKMRYDVYRRIYLHLSNGKKFKWWEGRNNEEGYYNALRWLTVYARYAYRSGILLENAEESTLSSNFEREDIVLSNTVDKYKL